MVREDLQHLMMHYSNSTAVLHLEGRPVYFMYNSYKIPAQEWAQLLTPKGNTSVRGSELDGEMTEHGVDRAEQITRP